MEPESRHFTSDLEQLTEIRTFVRDRSHRIWSDAAAGEALARLELAVSEAATNIMLHAYQREAGKPIDVLVEGDERQISVTMYHKGCAFDPESISPPAFDGSRQTGF